MAEIVADCPRCNSQKITFKVIYLHSTHKLHNWQNWYEAFSICQHCNRSTIFVVSNIGIGEREYLEKTELNKIPKTLNNFLEIRKYINIKDNTVVKSPEFLPPQLNEIFQEGATCLSTGCYNASGTMFRLCVDLVTREMLPNEEIEGLNKKVRRDLGLRLPWLFENGYLPKELQELSLCIKEDGNDGAHAGTLQKADAEDLLDFTVALLLRIYTEKEKLKLAQQRRDERRKSN